VAREFILPGLKMTLERSLHYVSKHKTITTNDLSLHFSTEESQHILWLTVQDKNMKNYWQTSRQSG
jgi:hypothetical protein